VSGEAYSEELEIAQPEFKANFESKDYFYQVSFQTLKKWLDGVYVKSFPNLPIAFPIFL